jgi:hypothetical protein
MATKEEKSFEQIYRVIMIKEEGNFPRAVNLKLNDDNFARQRKFQISRNFSFKVERKIS